MIPRKETQEASAKLSLRPADMKDCERLWQWRNEESTRQWSFHSAYIPYEEHQKWLADKLNDPMTKIFVILNQSGTGVGQVRFDINNDKNAEVNISIAAEQRKKGYGSAALNLASQFMTKMFDITKVTAHVKQENQASIAAFQKAGFIAADKREFKGHQAIEMAWNEEC